MNIEPPVHDFTKQAEAVAETKIPIPPKVYIALCSRDWMVEHYTSESVRHFGRGCKCEIVVGYMANDGVARSRNNLTAHFLEGDCTHLLFIDNDIIAQPRHLDRLLDANKDIVAGLYPKKQVKLDWVANYSGEKPDKDGLLKVRHAGTGFILIKRHVFEKIAKDFPGIAYGGDPSPESKRWDFFPMHAKDGVYKSEDWYFCEMAQQSGFDVWMDTKVQLRHVGKIVYPLQFTMGDEEFVDLCYHRYGITQDLIRTFIGSGTKQPGLMGGHTERFVRLWPVEYPVQDLHQGAELSGLYDIPEFEKTTRPPRILDVGADVGAFAIWASKRWEDCTIRCLENDPAKADFLAKTVTQIGVKFPKVKITVNAEIPDWKPTFVKIDYPEHEQEILQGLDLAETEYIVIRYHNETIPVLCGLMLTQTHFCHCHQQMATGGGVLKYMSRKLAASG